MSERKASELTLVLIKPDAVVRGLIGEIISRLERKGLKIVGLKMMQLNRERAEKLYVVHKGKPFFEGLIKHMTSAPVVALAVEGDGAVEVCRAIVGATDPRKAAPGTIRGDLAISIRENLVHASDSVDSAEYELPLFFSEGEICER
ncbi:MAG: nucleoside-diphosphate kinase [Candidatus Jordarchaeaceae archaeon]